MALHAPCSSPVDLHWIYPEQLCAPDGVYTTQVLQPCNKPRLSSGTQVRMQGYLEHAWLFELAMDLLGSIS